MVKKIVHKEHLKAKPDRGTKKVRLLDLLIFSQYSLIINNNVFFLPALSKTPNNKSVKLHN